ncbi:MAG TPA: hypothetical protein VKQ29_02770 [Aliidongia sp.]|nr:hypothetical protein [Aliidongia sp.]
MARDTIPSAPRGTSRSGAGMPGADQAFVTGAVHSIANALFSGVPPGCFRLFFEQTAVAMLQLRENAGTLPRL